MHIQTTQLGFATPAETRLRRAVLETAAEPITMLELVEKVSEIRHTSFPPRRIAELVTQMEAAGYVRITQ